MSQAGIASTKNIQPPPGSVTNIQGQDGVTVPPNGAGIIFVQATVAAAGGTPFTTTGNAGTNTETWTIQRSQAIGATNATNVGLSAFNSAQFTVDANAFVSLGGTIATTYTANSGTATPAANNLNVLATVAGAGGTPFTSTGAGSTITYTIQRTQTANTTSANIAGIASFNSAQFIVDGNGYVSTQGNTVAWVQITTSQTLLKNFGYFCVAAGGALALALPTTGSSTIGDLIEVTLDGATSWTITQAAGQQIRFSGSQTTAGAGGSLASTSQGDTIRMVYQAAGKWNVISSIGNLTVT